MRARPAEAATALELLERRARARPAESAFTFAGRAHPLGALWERIDAFAAGLAGRGVGSGARVVLALPNGPEFFEAFYGAQRVGAIPVPIDPRSGGERVADLVAACGASALVLPVSGGERVRAALGARAAQVPILTCGRPAPPGAAPRFPAIAPDQPALIQYTSGSTGDPRGVIVTHAGLLTNVRQMIAGMGITRRDVFVSWLPVHHDMGLVLMALVPLSIGARLVLLPSTLGDVREWLHAITVHRGTFTAAPDFAYRLCLRSVRDPARFDLRSLRVALNAAEPVRAATVRRFEQAFGLRRVMAAGYGLAEATVGVSMQAPGTEIEVDARGFVAVGRPFPGIRLHVVDGARPAAPGAVGELVVESPANTPGYFRNPRATAALVWRPGCIRTGDLGYRDEQGRVFVVGRTKNVIIQAGRNLAPQEIEEAVEALAFVRRAAAVGIDRGRAEGEQACVFAELRRAAPPPRGQLQELARQVVLCVYERLGLRPGRVCLLRPRAIPLTPNGKLRHAVLRASYLDGSLRARGRIVFPDA